MKIVHIINGLGDGGAENTLYKICKYDKINVHTVISFKAPSKYYVLLKQLGIETYCLDANFLSINKFFYLINLLLSLKPDIVQTWLVHADLIGSFAARLAGIKNIVWNVRYSNLKFGKTKLTTILIIKLLAHLSYFIPKSIVIASRKAKKIYEIVGYEKKKLKFIPNGYDLNTLKPEKKIKKKINIKKYIPKLGNVSRFDPQKDHLNLFNSLSLLRSKNINFFCILVGSGLDKDNINLSREIKRLRLSNNVKLLGQSDNITKVMNELDICVQSSSYGEGFPNVLAEAMACGTPCVATNVGDTSLIVGKTGWIVEPNNSIKLAEAIEKALNEIKSPKWSKKCKNARSRIKEKFDIAKMVNNYNKLWTNIKKN